MLVTFFAEWALAAWVYARYRMDRVGSSVFALLVLLGTFQLAEYVICLVEPSKAVAIFGYWAITFLPPLGIRLATTLAERDEQVARYSLFLAVVWCLLFAILPFSITTVACTGNYTILTLAHPAGLLYGVYYFGLIGIGMMYTYQAMISQSKMSRAAQWLFAGYAAILIPTVLVNIINAATRIAVPSIMCGFALLLALILAFGVLPRAGQRRS